MKKRAAELTADEMKKTLDLLYTAASTVKDRKGVKAFLRDLLTESERIMLGRRIWIARSLIQGRKFNDIAKEIGVGHATISRVAHWLADQFEGYEQAIKGVEKEFDKRAIQMEAKLNPFSYAALKRKFPLHFLLFPEPRPKRVYRR